MNLSKKETNRETSNPMLVELKVNAWNVLNNRKTKITELPKTLKKIGTSPNINNKSVLKKKKKNH